MNVKRTHTQHVWVYVYSKCLYFNKNTWRKKSNLLLYVQLFLCARFISLLLHFVIIYSFLICCVFSLFSLVFFIHSAHITVAPPFTSFQSLSLSLSVFVSFTLAHFWYDVFITWKTLNYAFLLSRNDRELYILKLSLFWFCEYVFVSLSFVHVVVVGVFHFLLSHVPSGGRDILYKSYQQWLSRLFNSSTSLSVQHVRRKIKRPADFLSHSLSHTPGCFVASTPYSIT